MPRRRWHSVAFKRRMVAEYHAGEGLHALARRRDLSRNPIRIADYNTERPHSVLGCQTPASFAERRINPKDSLVPQG
jgi:transposase-like protein